MYSEYLKKQRPIWISLLLSIATYFIGSWGVQKIMDMPMWDTPGSLQSDLREICRTINKNLPAMEDEHTRLDCVDVEDGDTLVYKFTILGGEKEIFDTSGIKSPFDKCLLKNYSEDTKLEDLPKRSINLKYQYFDTSGKLRFEVVIGS